MPSGSSFGFRMLFLDPVVIVCTDVGGLLVRRAGEFSEYEGGLGFEEEADGV